MTISTSGFSSTSAIYFLVAAGSSCQILIDRKAPSNAKGIKNIGHQIQLRLVKYPRLMDCKPVPKYTNPSTIPEQVAVALRPPKSAAAVPDIRECTPITAIEIITAAQPRISGDEYK